MAFAAGCKGTPRVEIKTPEMPGFVQILIDGFDISQAVTAVSVRLEAGSLPVVKFEIVAGAVEIDLPGSVLEVLRQPDKKEAA